LLPRPDGTDFLLVLTFGNVAVKVEAAWAAVKRCPQDTLPSKLVWFFRHGESESNVAMHAATQKDKDVRNSFIFRNNAHHDMPCNALVVCLGMPGKLEMSAAHDTARVTVL
jgi:hypothetical protein